MRLVTDFNLSEEDAISIISSISDGATQLLLGAGSSYGALGGDGNELKGGPDLARELNKEFKLDNEEPDASNLPLIYADVRNQSKLEDRLNAFLQKKFTNCKGTWQRGIFEFPWKKIWTLNIDDVLDACKVGAREIEFFSWQDKYKPNSFERNELQIVHLHGRAVNLTKARDEKFIFSIKEYAGRHNEDVGWHTEFHSEFVKKPFIVCGAKLQDEFDLIGVLEYGNRSKERGGAPSLIVLRDLTDSQSARYARQGLIPIKATGQSFFSALIDDLREWDAKKDKTGAAYELAALDVKSKFKRLSTSLYPPNKILDFYSSAETQWVHIIDNLDSPFEAVKGSINHINNIEKRTPKVSIIYGDQVCGKSATALRIGLDLINSGHDVWLFRAEERFNVDSIIEYVYHNKKAVFIFDDCADFSSSLQSVVDAAIKANQELKLVVTCDKKRFRAVQVDLAKALCINFMIEPVKKNDFIGLFQKRYYKGRLGRCSNVNAYKAWKEFNQTYDRRLLEWLESLENATSFREAILRIINDKNIGVDNIRQLVCAVAATHRFGFSLPYHIANSFLYDNNIDSVVGDGGVLSDLAYLDEQGIRLRSSAFSEFVWKSLSVGDRYNISSLVARKISPLVVPQSITKRTFAYRILRQLMDFEVVNNALSDRAEAWYGDLEHYCGWNARFWEQRALLASEQNNEIKAYSYAKKAVSLYGEDAFPHTTLGKICLKISIKRNDSIGVERFWEGVEELDKSRALAIESGLEWEHPYITFFTYTLKAISLPSFKQEYSKITNAWNNWMYNAKRSSNLIFEVDGKSRLELFERSWLLMAAKNSEKSTHTSS